MGYPTFVSGDVLGAADMNAVGLWKVTSASFSAVGTVNVNNCFTSSYTNYRVMVQLTASSTNQVVNMRLRASGTDAATTYYWGGIAGSVTSTTLYATPSNNATSWIVMQSQATGVRSLVMDVMAPAVAQITLVHGDYTDFNTGTNYTVGGMHATASAYDGFTLLAGAGGAATITGSYAVYGYKP